ncbi:M56 family metallopeptidase [Rhodococcus sp. IEGM 1241]|uniref:M56 family metallopeptidase n=1 Tax=Rhodococcus TaxID=1827 RepID=UPI001FB28782|nr:MULTISPECIES: M56 family metallopeptidase [unclassified Rhodococcus (in: high G+C Gram-positive bacteria)]MCJ0905226.1 M56 family metallopeptidase [Rhodococcus sp. ARC_M6]MDV8015540.1 M56 family metallopeptidase [Rhodococcus sp. IEGM 1241]
MTAVLTWAVGGLLVAALAPLLLGSMMRRGVDPHVALVTWSALALGTMVSIGVPVVLSLMPSHGGVSSLIEFAHSCWLALHDDAPARVETAVGVLGGAALAIGAVRGTVHLFRFSRTRHDLHQQHLGLLRILGGATSSSLLWLPVPTPFAYSVAGRPALIVASDGLREQLDPEALAAVLSHERAHISGRHHQLVSAAEALAYAFPWLPIMRSSPQLVRALVEIEADSRAVRQHGRESVHRALCSMTPHDVPVSALGIAQDCLALRLDRLSSPRTHHAAPVRYLRTLAACGTAIVLPAAPLLALLGAMAMATCAGT